MVARNRLEPGAPQRRCAGVDMQRGVFERGIEQHRVELGVVLDVHLLLAALDLVERRLGDVDVAALDEHRQLTVEERQQQRADVGAVDIGIGHQDDAVIAQFVDVELIFDAATERGDEGADLCGGDDLVEARLLDIEDLALERQDRLGATIAPLFGGAACRVALDDEELGARRVFFLAVGELARETRDVERALAAGKLTGFARGLTRPRGIDDLAGDGLGLARVLEQELGELGGKRGLDDALDLGGDELVFGLGGELRIRQLHREDRGQALARVVAGGRDFLALGDAFFFDVVVQCARERSAEAGEVRAAVLLRDVVGVAEHRLRVGVVPLHRHFDADRAFLAAEPEHAGVNAFL